MNIFALYQNPVSLPALTQEALSFAVFFGGFCAAALWGAFRFLSGIKKRRTDEHQVVQDHARQAADYAIARATEEKNRADELLRTKFDLEHRLSDCEQERDAYRIRLQTYGVEVDPDTGELPALE